MVTGIEAAGLALAILPLVVNQLDSYALGLEKIRLFRNYKEQLRGYARQLSFQRSALLNTLLLCLEDVVDDYDQLAELISNPQSPGWKDPELEYKLRDKLGQCYEPFTESVSGLCNLVEYLSHKLGAETPDNLAVPTKSMKPMKFPKILSSAVYKDILENIEKTNQILRAFIKDTQYSEQTRRGRRSYRQKNSLKRHQARRKHARELYRIMIQERKCWSCACQNTHVIGLELGSHQFEPSSTFRAMLSSANSSMPQARRWGEVELEAHKSQCSTYEGHCICSTLQFEASDGNGKVRFGNSYCAQSAAAQSTISRGKQVNNICSALHQNGSTSGGPQLNNMAYISDGNTADIRYYINRMDSSQGDIHLHSLKETFQITSPSSQDLGELSYYDSLYLATVLACTVLHFHGTWLQTHWSTQDILFLRTDQTQKLQYQQPYILCKVSGEGLDKGKGQGHGQFSNEVLFPLAIALIELSLGKSIHGERLDEDQGASEHETLLNTATRVLETKIFVKSGTDYVNVVRECLNWSQGPRRGVDFGDPHFDETVFDLTIYPLMKYFDLFRGVS